MSTSLADLLKFAVMHPLQERVIERGICSKCHTKTLQSKHVAAEMEWFQCSGCNTVYCLPERRLIG